jgi:hypothetical protein
MAKRKKYGFILTLWNTKQEYKDSIYLPEKANLSNNFQFLLAMISVI